MKNANAKVRYQDLRKKYFYELDPDDVALIFDFFIVFSRFEFALKRSNYFRGTEDKVEPDWDKFCVAVQERFNKTSSPEFQRACEYYTTYPPKKQVIQNGEVVWKDNIQGTGESEFRWIIRSVKTARNNLFHGGKFPYDQMRDTPLLFHGLVILHDCLKLDKKLERIFIADIM
jgi:hypothetical protein